MLRHCAKIHCDSFDVCGDTFLNSRLPPSDILDFYRKLLSYIQFCSNNVLRVFAKLGAYVPHHC